MRPVRFIKKNLMAKVGVVLLVTLVAAAAAGGATVIQTDSVVTEDVKESQIANAESQSNALDSWIVSMQGTGHSLGYASALQTKDPDQSSEFLEHEIGQEDVANDIEVAHYVNTTTGTVVASSDPSATGMSVSEFGYSGPEAIESSKGEADQSENEGHGGEQEHSEEEGSHTVAVSQPYNSSVIGGPAVGVAVSTETPERALVLVGNVTAHAEGLPQRTENSYLKVVNDRGTVVISQRQDQMLSQNKGDGGVDSMAVRKGLGGESGYMRMQMGGMVMTMGYAPMETANWTVMYHEPASSALAVKQQVTRNQFLAVGITAVGLLLIGGLTIRSVIPPLNTLTEKADAIEGGDYDTEIQSTRRDEFGQLFASISGMRDSLKERIAEAETQQERAQRAKQEAQQAQEEAQAAKAEAEELANQLQVKADEFSTAMSRAADGDLTTRLDEEGQNDAMRDIAQGFNDMMDEIEAAITEIDSFSESVTQASQRLSSASQDAEASSEDVTQSVTDISSGMTTQTENLGDASEQMSDLSATVEEVASTADEVATLSQRAVKEGEQGQELATTSMDKMRAIQQQTDSTVAEIEGLDSEIDRVGEIVELIDEIAEQTNMLALNANIEAARAGETGEGFAVVANEVKQLAEETQEATGEIEQRIQDVRGKSGDAVENMREMQQLVEEGTETIENGLRSLEDIVETVNEANDGVQSISKATDEQANSTQQVVTVVDDVASISEKTNERADDVAATTEEQSDSIAQVADDARSLAEQSQSLQELVDEFVVNSDTAATEVYTNQTPPAEADDD
jgi:methyl-accepting chemotaxis protein